MLVEQVVEPGLATELVHSLCDLVAGSVPQTREEREEFATGRGSSGVAEEDGVQRASGDLSISEGDRVECEGYNEGK